MRRGEKNSTCLWSDSKYQGRRLSLLGVNVKEVPVSRPSRIQKKQCFTFPSSSLISFWQSVSSLCINKLSHDLKCTLKCSTYALLYRIKLFFLSLALRDFFFLLWCRQLLLLMFFKEFKAWNKHDCLLIFWTQNLRDFLVNWLFPDNCCSSDSIRPLWKFNSVILNK